jgi:hypothetical protein
MSYRYTLEAALESLHEIEDLVKGFPGNGEIPAVEIDLTLQKLRNLYELMLMMKKPGEEAIGEVAAALKKEEAVAAAAAAVKQEETAGEVAAATDGKKPKSTKKVQTLADQFRGGTTLHESLHKAFNKEDDTLYHGKEVTDLLAAIGINDRFTFIRELFTSDAAAFEHTISTLNDASNFNDAYNYMIQHFDWDMDSEPVQLLLDIIRRKFIKGRHE